MRAAGVKRFRVEKQGQERDRGLVNDVVLELQVVGHREFIPFVDDIEDASGTIRILPVMGDRVRISRVDQSVVGVDDQSRGRVLDFRETVERYEALQVVASVGPRHGNLPLALLANRAAYRCVRADVSLPGSRASRLSTEERGGG